MINSGDKIKEHIGEESTGTLIDISLMDVLQVLSVNRKTCTLFLKNDEEKGEIYLHEGKIIDAKSGEFRGEQALFYLLNWDGADFFIGTSVEGSLPARIEKDLQSLILEWIEHHDRTTGEKTAETVAETAIEEKVEEKPEVDNDTLSFLKKLEATGIIRAIS